MGMLLGALRFWTVPVTLMLGWAGLSAGAVAHLASIPIEGPRQPTREVIMIQPVRPGSLPEQDDESQPLRFDKGDCSKRVCWTALDAPQAERGS